MQSWLTFIPSSLLLFYGLLCFTVSIIEWQSVLRRAIGLPKGNANWSLRARVVCLLECTSVVLLLTWLSVVSTGLLVLGLFGITKL